MKAAWRWLVLFLLAIGCLQLYFVSRIAFMTVVNPQSTAFERSEAWRIATEPNKQFGWRYEWVPYTQMSDNLKRAVIASEDGDFIYHDGVEWEAIEKAWQKNALAEQSALKRNSNGKSKTPKIIGGSTITQQLAKNLFLSGERQLLRKAQEFMLTLGLELFLSKERILEIYLNSVEWGEGVFGAEAASQRYFGKSASKLSTYEAARLAVMLPRPKFFEKVPHSAYVSGRAQTIVGRMADAELP
jgi:monofunctional glycosyltransferase